jgi:hypothetical protein
MNAGRNLFPQERKHARTGIDLRGQRPLLQVLRVT